MGFLCKFQRFLVIFVPTCASQSVSHGWDMTSAASISMVALMVATPLITPTVAQTSTCPNSVVAYYARGDNTISSWRDTTNKYNAFGFFSNGATRYNTRVPLKTLKFNTRGQRTGYTFAVYASFTGSTSQTWSALLGGRKTDGDVGGTELFFGKEMSKACFGMQDSVLRSIECGETTTDAFTDGKKHSFIYTQSANRLGRVYVDGVDVTGSEEMTWSGSFADNEQILIGTEDENNGYPWTGSIDEVLLLNTSIDITTARQLDTSFSTNVPYCGRLTTTSPSSSPTASPTHAPTLDLCNVHKCSLDCFDECGWDTKQTMCVTGETTDAIEHSLRLGDCPSFSPTTGRLTTTSPSSSPTPAPTLTPSTTPTVQPTSTPTWPPTMTPTIDPTLSPTSSAPTMTCGDVPDSSLCVDLSCDAGGVTQICPAKCNACGPNGVDGSNGNDESSAVIIILSTVSGVLLLIVTVVVGVCYRNKKDNEKGGPADFKNPAYELDPDNRGDGDRNLPERPVYADVGPDVEV